MKIVLGPFALVNKPKVIDTSCKQAVSVLFCVGGPNCDEFQPTWDCLLVQISYFLLIIVI